MGDGSVCVNPHSTRRFDDFARGTATVRRAIHPPLLRDRVWLAIFLQTLHRASQMSKLPVRKGTLDLLVLRALTWAPMHGFEIVSWLEQAALGSLEIEDSALYQAVYRLEEKGLLQADWG